MTQRKQDEAQARAAALLEEGYAHTNSEREEPALALFLQALELVEDGPASAVQVDAINAVGLAHYRRGDAGRALEYFARVRSAAEEAGDPARVAMATHNIGFMHFRLGRLEEALAELEEAAPVLRASGDPVYGISRHMAARIYDRTGRSDRALAVYLEAIAGCPPELNAPERARALTNLGLLQRRLGRHAAALESFRSAMDAWAAAGRPRSGRRLHYLAFVQALRLGRLAESSRLLPGVILRRR